MTFAGFRIAILICVLHVMGSTCAALSQTIPEFTNHRSSLSLDFSRTEISLLAVGSMLTYAAFMNDSPEQAQVTVDRYADGVADLGNAFGSTYTALGITAGLAGIGLIGNKPAMSNAAIDLGKSLLVTGAIVGVMKVSIDRQRPNRAGLSFPSGHTAVAFTTSTVLAKHFGWKVGVPLYATAAFTGLGRMEDKKHFFSDVIAGATIGLLVGRLVPSRSKVSVFGNAKGVGVDVWF